VTTKTAGDVQVGDRVSVRGVDLTVTRIDAPFLGRDNMLLLVESTDQRWACVPVTDDLEVEVS
jgi:riboflavin synthase alpha subunit